MDDAQLLAASAAGDSAAFAVFYRRYLSLVVAYCLDHTHSRETAADLTAEVFAAAFEASGRYQALHASAAAWLLGIARNKLLMSLRRGRVEDQARRRLGMAPVALEDEDLERVEELAALADSRAGALVGGLPVAERDAVRAHVLDDRSYGEIAAELGCSESVVRKRVSRGLARVRARLTAEGRYG